MQAVEEKILNVSLLEPRLKHPTVFSWFDALSVGESFILLNDHDPIPLFYEMKAERGEVSSNRPVVYCANKKERCCFAGNHGRDRHKRSSDS